MDDAPELSIHLVIVFASISFEAIGTVVGTAVGTAVGNAIGTGRFDSCGRG